MHELAFPSSTGKQEAAGLTQQLAAAGTAAQARTSDGLPSSVMRASPFFTISAAAANTRRSADCRQPTQAQALKCGEKGRGTTLT